MRKIQKTGAPLLALSAVLLALASCAESDLPRPVAANDRDTCLTAFRWLDQETDRQGVADAEAVPIPGYPFLRTNRFLQSLAAETDTPKRFRAWVRRLSALDRQARIVEVRNLSGTADPPFAEPDKVLRALANCRPLLETGLDRKALLKAADVPDSYSDVDRVLGLYPITGVGAVIGFDRWKRRAVEIFRHPAERGEAVRYRPAGDERFDPAETAAILKRAREPVFGLTEPDRKDLERLFAAYAPIFEVEGAPEMNRVGTPSWRLADGRPVLGFTPKDVVYTRLTHSWFGGRIVPQLVYTIWFRERPAHGMIDLTSGRLDGIVWRVTLDANGDPLVYDTIHACGCYQLFFPVPPVQRIAMPEDSDAREEAIVPAHAPQLQAGQRIVVRISSGDHYVVGLSMDKRRPDNLSRIYALRLPVPVPDFALRTAAIPGDGPGRTRSVYGTDGLIAGSERLERFVLWPMGIPSAGAMRQWGHHATAFVGRRHFDDPDLLDHAFAISHAGLTSVTFP